MKDKKTKDACEKYSEAVFDIITDEAISMPKEELFNHLRQCEKCREELFDWRNTYTVMRMECDAKKPAQQQKIANMVANIKRELYCNGKGTKTLHPDVEIGKPAGELWKILAKEGPIKVADIPAKMEPLKYDIDQAYGGYGWLTLQNKVDIFHNEIGKCVDLTPKERQQVPFAEL